MATKDNLLALLTDRAGEYLSGEELAQQLGVSRTAVWKAVNTLRRAGFEIDAVQNKGYSLVGSRDVLHEGAMRKYLTQPIGQLLVQPTVTSTNAVLRELAADRAPEGTVVIAGEQTRGRGRLGRSFYSPADTGLYLSLLLRPDGFSPAQAVYMTTMAAVAVCQAIEAVSGRNARIKWVNDIFLDGRKVCGILTEGSFDLETGSLNSIILGVGINVYAPADGFPRELEQIAGAVFPEPITDGRSRLAAEFLNRFLELYRQQDSTYAAEYRRRSLVLGRQVLVITPAEQKTALALDVDEECRLLVQYPDGKTEALSSAEISVKVE